MQQAQWPTRPWALPLTVSYVDDGALAAECTAPQAVQVASDLLGIAHAAAASFRLELSYKRGKMEAMLIPRGKGSRAVRREVWSTPGYRVPVAGTTIAAGVTYSYKHLGGQVAASGAMWEEITHRCTSAREPVEQLRRSLFSARGVPPETH